MPDTIEHVFEHVKRSPVQPGQAAVTEPGAGLALPAAGEGVSLGVGVLHLCWALPRR
jgi:hypothetical protein